MPLLQEFRTFALRGNVIDLAVGFTVGAAFTTVARSLVGDIIMPVVGLLTGGADFSDLYWLLAPGSAQAPPYASLAAAQQAGAVTVNYGAFVNNVLALVLVALVMFSIIKALHRVEQRLEERSTAEPPTPDEPDSKKCPFCRSTIPFRASRCPHCTSQLEPAAAEPTA